VVKSQLCSKSFDSVSSNFTENLIHKFSEAVGKEINGLGDKASKA